MINWIMKKSGEIALKTDVGKLDLARLPEEITEIKDISYIDDNDPGHTLDIYVRKDGSKKPILIDIHGGGFISEDKAMNRLFGNYMAKLGFVVFELNVRLAASCLSLYLCHCVYPLKGSLMVTIWSGLMRAPV